MSFTTGIIASSGGGTSYDLSGTSFQSMQWVGDSVQGRNISVNGINHTPGMTILKSSDESTSSGHRFFSTNWNSTIPTGAFNMSGDNAQAVWADGQNNGLQAFTATPPGFTVGNNAFNFSGNVNNSLFFKYQLRFADYVQYDGSSVNGQAGKMISQFVGETAGLVIVFPRTTGIYDNAYAIFPSFDTSNTRYMKMDGKSPLETMVATSSSVTQYPVPGVMNRNGVSYGGLVLADNVSSNYLSKRVGMQYLSFPSGTTTRSVTFGFAPRFILIKDITNQFTHFLYSHLLADGWAAPRALTSTVIPTSPALVADRTDTSIILNSAAFTAGNEYLIFAAT